MLKSSKFIKECHRRENAAREMSGRPKISLRDFCKDNPMFSDWVKKKKIKYKF